VTFTRFILPFLKPARWDLLLPLLLALASALAVLALGAEPWAARLALDGDSLAAEPWRLLSYVVAHEHPVTALGNGIAVTVGMSMTARASGRWVAWAGFLGSVVLAGLYTWMLMGKDATLLGASPAVYAALGMGGTSWLKMRDEITYQRRADWMAGFGVLGVVAFALAVPRLLDNPVRWVHAVGIAWGAALGIAGRREWGD
jgi:membrane associated rhomboid family serine protease